MNSFSECKCNGIIFIVLIDCIFFRSQTTINNCDELFDWYVSLITYVYKELCPFDGLFVHKLQEDKMAQIYQFQDEQIFDYDVESREDEMTTIIPDNAGMDGVMDSILDTLEEVAAPAAIAGGAIAVATLFAMPPLPMTLASGIPPGK